MIETLLEEHHKLLREWHFAGYVEHDNFVDLAQISRVNQFNLIQDKLLILIVCIVSNELGIELPSNLDLLIKSQTVWYPNYFSDQIVRQNTSDKFLFHPLIAIKYFLARRPLTTIDQFNHSPDQYICGVIIKHHVTLRHSKLLQLFDYPDLGKYFQHHQVLLYDTHHLRWLHLIADDHSYDLLLCLETGLIGIDLKLFADEGELLAAQMELEELKDLPLFRDRLYIPTFAAKTIYRQYPFLGRGLGQIHEYWHEHCESKFSAARSAKFSIIEMLQAHNYFSPFGINN